MRFKEAARPAIVARALFALSRWTQALAVPNAVSEHEEVANPFH
jgi:hypothetical protein